MDSNLQLEKAPSGDFLSRVPYPSAGGNDKDSLWDGLNMAKKGVVCQEEKIAKKKRFNGIDATSRDFGE
jgi:hypothetical protein